MIRNSTNEISIKPKMSPAMRLASIAGGIVFFAVGIYAAYSAGVRSGNDRLDQDRLMISQLNDTIVELRSDLDNAEALMIAAQRQRQIQEEAYKQISKAYAGSEQKNAYLGSRLDFYRSIISPEDGQSGPAIHAAEITLDDNRASFDITLVQSIKHKHQVQGTLKVGLYDGNQPVGQWPENSPRSVNYQYFLQVSGAIEAAKLPENARLKVELSVQNGETIERWFDIVQQS